MKKGLALGLIGIVAAGTLASAVPVSANTFTGASSGDTEFVGSIGEFDPSTTDPGNNIPPAGDQAWVKVELPTRIAYWSDASTNYKTIKSATHTITNQSNYPVKVSLGAFKGDSTDTPDIAGLKDLSINSFKLLENKALKPIDSSSLTMKLAAGGSIPAQDVDGNKLVADKDWKLNITGAVADDLTGSKVLNNKLVFTFKALDAVGDEVPAP
ncbi:MAG: hypothetical protein LBV19_08915 [Streptococcaceae bacterium]|jgi:hypothetical protein|nr:hypothetical protein [Streptococcaceae bacterium]